jgi:hypothetical protein
MARDSGDVAVRARRVVLLLLAACMPIRPTSSTVDFVIVRHAEKAATTRATRSSLLPDWRARGGWPGCWQPHHCGRLCDRLSPHPADGRAVRGGPRAGGDYLRRQAGRR